MGRGTGASFYRTIRSHTVEDSAFRYKETRKCSYLHNQNQYNLGKNTQLPPVVANIHFVLLICFTETNPMSGLYCNSQSNSAVRVEW